MNINEIEVKQVRDALLNTCVSEENADAFIAFYTADEFSQELMDKIHYVPEYNAIEKGRYINSVEIRKYIMAIFNSEEQQKEEKAARFINGLSKLGNYHFTELYEGSILLEAERNTYQFVTEDTKLLRKLHDEGIFVKEYYEDPTRRDALLASLRRLTEIVEKDFCSARGLIYSQYLSIKYPVEKIYNNLIEIDGYKTIPESVIGNIEIDPQDVELINEYEELLICQLKENIESMIPNEVSDREIFACIDSQQERRLKDVHNVIVKRGSTFYNKYPLINSVTNFALSKRLANIASAFIYSESNSSVSILIWNDSRIYDLCKYNMINLFDMDKGRFLHDLLTLKDDEFKKYIIENRKDIILEGFVYMEYESQYELYKELKEKHPDYLEEIFKDREPHKKNMVDFIIKNIFSSKITDESDMEVIRTYLTGESDEEHYVGKVVDLVFKYKQFYDEGWEKLPYGVAVYKRCTNDDEFVARVEVLALIFEKYNTYYTKRYSSKNIGLMLHKRMKDAIIPIMFFGVYLDRIVENDSKIGETLVPVLAEDLPELGQCYYDEFKSTSLAVKNILLQAMGTDVDNWKEQILSYAAEVGKETLPTLVKIFSENKELRRHAFDFVVDKKKDVRELGIKIFALSMDQEAFDKLTQVSETEKDKKLQKLLMQTLAEADIEIPESELTVEKIVEKLHQAGKAKAVSWVFATLCVPVHDLEGNEVPQEVLEGILIPFAFMKTVEISKDSAFLSKNCNKEDLAKFMTGAFSLWLESGAEAKNKWILYPASIFGGSKIKPALIECIDNFVDQSRGALAGEVVKALSLNSDPTAIVLVDNMSRKYKHKGVRNAACEAMESAASILRITKAQLEDRIVPTLDFDEECKRIFDYGTRQFVVSLGVDLSLKCATAEGKAIKALPAPGASDDAAKASEASKEFKELKKQLKLVVDTQTVRLEDALAVSRYWTKEEWCTLFVKNPIMHQFATGLVWGTYGDGKLVDSFRYMEDGSFNTVDENEYEINDDALVGLVHPLDMSSEDLAAWKQQLEDYEVKQPFDQLGRETFTVTEEEKVKTLCTRFKDIVMNDSTLVNRLTKMGWSRGEVIDNGVFDAFYRKDDQLGLAVTLFHTGITVGYMGDQVTIKQLGFYKSDNISKDSFGIKNGEDSRAIKIENVQTRYFSEMLLQVKNATASSAKEN